MTDTGYGSPADLEARKRLGAAIKRAMDSQGIEDLDVSSRTGSSLLELHLLISGDYERAWDFPQRHEVQQVLHWASGSWEQVLRGEIDDPPQFL